MIALKTSLPSRCVYFMLIRSSRIAPKCGTNPQLAHLVNQNRKVVAENLAQRLVDIATSVLLRSESSNFRFIMENADSMFDRLR